MNQAAAKREPKYVSIYKELRTHILSGEAVFDKLPPENQLMAHYGVSRTTIRKAPQLLKDESLIQSRQGRGTDIVFSQTLSKGAHMRRVTSIIGASFSYAAGCVNDCSYSDMLMDVIPASEEISAALDIAPGENVYRIRWLHHVNDTPYMYLCNYVRMDLAPTLPQVVKDKSSLYRIFAEEFGLIFESAQESVEPVTADFINARLLEVPVGTPLLLICRTTRFNKGPAEYSRRYVRPDQQRLTLHLK